MKKRINLWSSPRNISTAFMYSWGNRVDCSVVDEPLYAHYLRVSDADHPGKEEILKSQCQFAEKVVQEVLLKDYDTKLSLFKQMTHHLVDMDWEFLLEMENVLLIRNPREIIASYAKVIPHPNMQDIGIKKQVELFDFLRNNGKLNAIIDTNELLKNPKQVLGELCDSLGINFDDKMLSWKAGARKEDGIWARYWYKNVHASTGFKTYEKKEIELRPDLEELAQEAMPHYEKLFEHCIKAKNNPH